MQREVPLPNFVVIGAPKAGTTSLCYHLAHHPQVCFSSKKETNFFTWHYDRGIDWYRRYFSHWDGQPAVGEGTVYYALNAWYPYVPERIAEHLPDARFVYMTRHPINRLESMWVQHQSTGLPIPGFNQAIREWRPLLEGSLYDYQLGRYLRHFPADRFKCLFFEDFIKDPAAALRDVCTFIGVDPALAPDAADENRNPRGALKVDRGPWKNLRNTRLGRACRAYVPEPAKEAMRKVFRKPIDVEARWDEVTLRWAVDQVRDDAARWLARHGRDEGFWDLSEAYIHAKLQKQGVRPAPPEAVDPGAASDPVGSAMEVAS